MAAAVERRGAAVVEGHGQKLRGFGVAPVGQRREQGLRLPGVAQGGRVLLQVFVGSAQVVAGAGLGQGVVALLGQA